MHVSNHDSDSSGVDGAKVGVLEKTDQVSLGGFLEGEDGRALESDILFVFLSKGFNDSLEWKLSQEKSGGLLVSSDFSQGDGSWSISVWLLNSSGGLSTSGALLGSDSLSWSLNSA